MQGMASTTSSITCGAQSPDLLCNTAGYGFTGCATSAQLLEIILMCTDPDMDP